MVRSAHGGLRLLDATCDLVAPVARLRAEVGEREPAQRGQGGSMVRGRDRLSLRRLRLKFPGLLELERARTDEVVEALQRGPFAGLLDLLQEREVLTEIDL